MVLTPMQTSAMPANLPTDRSVGKDYRLTWANFTDWRIHWYCFVGQPKGDRTPLSTIQNCHLKRQLIRRLNAEIFVVHADLNLHALHHFPHLFYQIIILVEPDRVYFPHFTHQFQLFDFYSSNIKITLKRRLLKLLFFRSSEIKTKKILFFALYIVVAKIELHR